MVRISTKYDNTIVNNKEVGKVFMIRGDEGYARTTDMIFNTITDNTSADSIQGYKVAFCYDVLRDVGSSTVILYDNDIVLKEFDWSSDNGMQYIGTTNDHTVIDPTTCLYLPYDEEHNLWMKYNGNTNSLYSKSKPVKVYCDLPLEFYTNITYDNINLSGDDITFDLSLTIHGEVTSATYHKSIELYLDDELVDTVTTGSDSNVANCELNGITRGHHIITAIVVGDEDIYTATKSYEFDAGYDISIVSYPNPFINGVGGDIVVRVLFNGEAVSDATVDFSNSSATTDTDGYATIQLSSLVDSGEYTAICDDVESAPVYITVANPSLSIDAYRTYMIPFGANQITFNTGELIENIPITYERISPLGRSSSTIYTENTGNASVWEEGKEDIHTEGKITYNAWIDGLKSTTQTSKTIYDPIIYSDGSELDDLVKFKGAYLNSRADGVYVAYKNSNETLRMVFPKTDDDFQIDFDLKMLRCTKFSMKLHDGTSESTKMTLVDTSNKDMKSGKFSVMKKGNTVTLIHANKTWKKTYDTTAQMLHFFFDTYSTGLLIKINSINYYKI